MTILRSLIVVALIAAAGCSDRDADLTSPSCTYLASANRLSFDAGGGTATVGVTTSGNCAWGLSSDSPWLTFSGAATGTGNATIPFAVAANSGAVSRTARIAFPGGVLSITQSGTACTYAVAPAALSFDTSGGTKTVQLTAGEGCAWTATAQQPWIAITRAPAGSGSAAIDITVGDFASADARTGTVTIGGRTVSVTQAGTGCSIAIDPTAASVGSAGGTLTFAVTATAACSWTADSQNVWIAVTENGSGPGPKTVTYRVAPNASADERVGRITVADQTLYITQAGTATP